MNRGNTDSFYQDESDLIYSTIEQYYREFSYLKPSRVLKFNHTPAIFVSKRVFTVNSKFKLWLILKFVMIGLKKRNYKNSSFDCKEIKLLGKDIALVEGIVRRFDHSEREIETIWVIYTLRKIQGNWKIVVGIYP